MRPRLAALLIDAGSARTPKPRRCDLPTAHGARALVWPRLLAICVMVGACGMLPSSAIASPNSEALLRLLKRRPRGMSVDTWRDQRREATRELGRRKERRAVPYLLKIIDSERFDVILEIAIDALGNIGDKHAVAPLRRLLNDPSLDGYVRDAVAGALSKLGALEPDQTTSTTPTDKPGGTELTGKPGEVVEHPLPTKPGLAARLAASAHDDGFGKLPALGVGDTPPDLLGRSERFDILAGAADLRWDGWSENTGASLSLGSRYRRQLERRTFGYSVDAATSLGFRLSDPAGDNNTTWGVEHALEVRPEVRYYPLRKDLPLFFGQISAGLGHGLAVSSPASALDTRFSYAATLSIGTGLGYGRILDVGSDLRLKRFERVLRKAGVLDGSIDAATANKLLRQWYRLRNRFGNYAQLGYALRTIREAGLLRERVDPATAYRLVRILDDPQLIDRRSGMMFRVGYGYARELILDASDRHSGFVYGTGELRLQLGTIRELYGGVRLLWNHLGEPNGFNVNFDGGYNWLLYNRAFDPLGAIGATLSGGLSNQPGTAFQGGGISYQMLAGASYTRFFDRGSRIVAGLRGGIDRRGGVVLFSLEAQYGIAYGSFVTKQAPADDDIGAAR